MEYLSSSLLGLAGFGFLCMGIWMLSMEARQLRLSRYVGECQRERARVRRVLGYHGMVVGLVRAVLTGRRLTDRERAELAAKQGGEDALRG